MIRRLASAALVGAFGALWLSPAASPAQNKSPQWGTVKGRVVWDGKDIPKRKPVNAVAAQLVGCGLDGPPLDESLVVNPKNRGLKWVVVSLFGGDGGAPAIHPDLQKIKEKAISLDQPHCMFIPRMIALREGQDLIAKNSSPINHNVRWGGNPAINVGGNVTIPPGKSFTIKGLAAEPIPLIVQCNFHPWMLCRLAVFDHPYFAVTDENGNFEIKLAPAGNLRLVAYQEAIGWRGGRPGKNGSPITVKAGGVTDLGELKMGK